MSATATTTNAKNSKYFERQLMLEFKDVIRSILVLLIKVVTIVVNAKMSVEQVVSSISVLIPKQMSKQLEHVKTTDILTPFMIDHVDSTKCKGIKKNKGLYTQCNSKRPQKNPLCSACQKQNCGTVDDRIADYNRTHSYYTYTVGDNTPTPYINFISGLTKSEVETALGISNIPDEHFEYTGNDETPDVKIKSQKTLPATNFVNNLLTSIGAIEPEPTFVTPDTDVAAVDEIAPTVVIEQKKTKSKVANKTAKKTTPTVKQTTPVVVVNTQPVQTGEQKALGKSKTKFDVYKINGEDVEYYCNPKKHPNTLFTADGDALVEAYSRESANSKWIPFSD